MKHYAGKEEALLADLVKKYGPEPAAVNNAEASETSEPEEEPLEEEPLNVTYCGICSVPPEYCAYLDSFDKCRCWLEKNVPELVREHMHIACLHQPLSICLESTLKIFVTTQTKKETA